jgi:hypothetical protein
MYSAIRCLATHFGANFILFSLLKPGTFLKCAINVNHVEQQSDIFQQQRLTEIQEDMKIKKTRLFYFGLIVLLPIQIQ